MQTNDEKKISNCPFCRATAQLYIRNNQYTVRCNNHNCIAYDIEPHFVSADAAIDAWNANEVGRVHRLLPENINEDSLAGASARLWAKMDVKNVILFNNSVIFLVEIGEYVSKIDLQFIANSIVITRNEVKKETNEVRTLFDVYTKDDKYSTELINGEPKKEFECPYERERRQSNEQVH